MLTIIEGARNSGKTFLLSQLENPVFKFPFTGWFERLGLKETCTDGHCLGLGKEIMIHELNKNGYLNSTYMDRGIITALAWGVFQKRITQEEAMNQFDYFIKDGLFQNVKIIYIVGKIICEVIPDFGAGMGAVTVFTTPIKNVLKFLSDGAIWIYEWLKPVAFAILSGMRKLLQYFGFLNIIMGFINMLKMFTSRDYAASTNDFINTAELWDESTYPEVASTEGLVSCTLPNGTVEQLSPQECLDAGGTFEGMDLLSDLADINNQIALHNSGATGQCQEGAECIHLNMEECLIRQEQGYCTWHSLYGDNEIIDCLLPDGSIAQMSPQECLDAGGQILTSDLLNQLLAQQDALMSQLNGLGLGDAVLDENLITSLLYPNADITVEDITEQEGARYGFYGAQTGNVEVRDELDPAPTTQGNNMMMKKGGKIKRKPKKRKNK